MNLIKIFFIMLVIVSCQEKQIWQEIEVGKNIKIESSVFNLENNNYIYNWSKPIGADGGVEYIIQHNTFLKDMACKQISYRNKNEKSFYS